MAQQWDRKSSSKSTVYLEVGEQKVQERECRWPRPEMLKTSENDHA